MTGACAGAAGNQHGQSAFAAHAAHALPNGEPLEPSALTNGDTPSQPPHPASYMEVSQSPAICSSLSPIFKALVNCAGLSEQSSMLSA